MKLIDKSALVAEIDRQKIGYNTDGKHSVEYDTTRKILNIIDTLEVKEVKEPTASDRGMAEEIIINLKRVEQDYHIDLTREMEWLRSKVKK